MIRSFEGRQKRELLSFMKPLMRNRSDEKMNHMVCCGESQFQTSELVSGFSGRKT